MRSLSLLLTLSVIIAWIALGEARPSPPEEVVEEITEEETPQGGRVKRHWGYGGGYDGYGGGYGGYGMGGPTKIIKKIIIIKPGYGGGYGGGYGYGSGYGGYGYGK